MAAHPPSHGTVWNSLPSRSGPLFVASAVAPFGASWSPIRARIGRGGTMKNMEFNDIMGDSMAQKLDLTMI
jgi:hypothetical protein